MPEVIFGPRRNAAARKLAASQNTDKHPNWGGRRPGSGRKPAGERPLDAMIVVRMTDKQKAFFKMAGGSAQDIYFVEFDGLKIRKYTVQIMGE